MSTSEPTVLMRDYMGTSFANGDPAHTFGLRLQRCYELAGHAMLFGDLREWVLVHGSIHRAPAPVRIGHAWLVSPDGTQVWEPITGKVYDCAEFYDWAGAIDEVRYTYKEAAVEVLKHEHYGRWHTSEHP